MFLTVAQAAALYGVRERSFHDLRKRGLVPEPYILGERSLRWHRDELVAHTLKVAPRGNLPMPERLAKAKRESEKAQA